MTGSWRLGVRNLLRNPRRTLLAALSVAVGSGSLIFTMGYVDHIERYLETTQIHLLHTGHLGVYRAAGYEQAQIRPQEHGFAPEQQAAIAAVLAADPNVERHIPYLVGSGMVSSGCDQLPFRATGLPPADLSWLYTRDVVLREAPELATFVAGGAPWDSTAEAPLVLGQGLARMLNKPLTLREAPEAVGSGFVDCADPSAKASLAQDAWVQLVSETFDGRLAAMDGQVAAHITTGFSEYENNTLLLPLDVLQRFYGTELVTYTAVFLRDAEDIDAKAADLERRLTAAGLDIRVYPWTHPATSPNYTSQVPLLRIIEVFIVLIMLAVVGLGIVNSMTMAILERRKEFGTLRALGYTPDAILGLVARETTALVVAALGVGAVGGVLAALATNALNVRIKPPAVAGTIQFVVQPGLGTSAGISVAIWVLALASTLLVARGQLRRRIVDLLYSEDAR